MGLEEAREYLYRIELPTSATTARSLRRRVYQSRKREFRTGVKRTVKWVLWGSVGVLAIGGCISLADGNVKGLRDLVGGGFLSVLGWVLSRDIKARVAEAGRLADLTVAEAGARLGKLPCEWRALQSTASEAELGLARGRLERLGLDHSALARIAAELGDSNAGLVP